MIELKFDTEGITSCPMNETATKEKCIRRCAYYGWSTSGVSAKNPIAEVIDLCSYSDKFPEPSEEK